jgi:hypothetical protein
MGYDSEYAIKGVFEYSFVPYNGKKTTTEKT